MVWALAFFIGKTGVMGDLTQFGEYYVSRLLCHFSVPASKVRSLQMGGHEQILAWEQHKTPTSASLSKGQACLLGPQALNTSPLR